MRVWKKLSSGVFLSTRNCSGAFLMNMNPYTVEMKVTTAVNVSSNAQNSVLPIVKHFILMRKGYVTVTEADNTRKYLPTFVSK